MIEHMGDAPLAGASSSRTVLLPRRRWSTPTGSHTRPVLQSRHTQHLGGKNDRFCYTHQRPAAMALRRCTFVLRIPQRSSVVSSMQRGYARVSTAEQTMDAQIDALHDADCDEVFADYGDAVREVAQRVKRYV